MPDGASDRRDAAVPPGAGDAPRAGSRADLSAAEPGGAARDRAFSGQGRTAIDGEAPPASKEALQSLNEELGALNGRLQAALEQQRATADDLQNVLCSTDVAMLFLDTELRIRFFTPATRSLFPIVQGDVGRPLADLRPLAGDGLLADDARAVLAHPAPIEREVEAPGGAWFRRRILPYRTHDDRVEGVVITFRDVTRRRHAGEALEGARQQADLANTARSRFLAAASHDLRQPLQTMSLLQGLLGDVVEGEAARGLVARLGDSLGAMSGMLNALLDINQIEAGVVRAELATFPIGDLLGRLRRDFATQAQAQSVRLRVVGCSATVHSDPRLLEQMIRNLLSNALRYTRSGTVLLGCRRRGAVLGVEVWDTGSGIPDAVLRTIFDERRQLDNRAHERSHGLGLGLSIVQRLGALLSHRVRVRSWPGRGSVFAIDVALPPRDARPPHRAGQRVADARVADARAGVILLVEDDPGVREHLELLLAHDGHRALVAADGRAALDLVAAGTLRPDLLLSDYNLPNGMDGLELAATLRTTLGAEIPAIILTGDVSTPTLRAIAGQDCLRLTKPVRVAELARAIQDLLPSGAVPSSLAPSPIAPSPEAPLAPATPAAARPAGANSLAPHVVHVVDDDGAVRHAIRAVLEAAGASVEEFATAEAFLADHRPGGGCLLVDAYMPGMSGLALLERLQADGCALPAIMITGNSDVPVAVAAMKAGALDFIEKPIDAADLVARIARAIEHARDATKLSEWREGAARSIAGLTARQREIMDLVLAGHPSKNIAADLAISQRTVENHRASIMRKTGAGSLPALARLALAAGGSDRGDDPGAAPPGR